MQQPVRLCYIVHVRRCRCYAMHYSRLSVRTDVYLHPKVPPVPLLRLTHLRVAITSTVLCYQPLLEGRVPGVVDDEVNQVVQAL